MTSFLDKWNRAVEQAKELRKGDNVPNYMIECVLNAEDRVRNEEIELMYINNTKFYKTNKGFLTLVKDNEESESGKEQVQKTAKVIPIREGN